MCTVQYNHIYTKRQSYHQMTSIDATEDERVGKGVDVFLGRGRSGERKGAISDPDPWLLIAIWFVRQSHILRFDLQYVHTFVLVFFDFLSPVVCRIVE